MILKLCFSRTFFCALQNAGGRAVPNPPGPPWVDKVGVRVGVQVGVQVGVRVGVRLGVEGTGGRWMVFLTHMTPITPHHPPSPPITPHDPT